MAEYVTFTLEPASPPTATRCHTVEVVLLDVVCPTCVHPAGAVAVMTSLATVVTMIRPSPPEMPLGTDTDRLVALPCAELEPTKVIPAAVTVSDFVAVSATPLLSVTFSDTWWVPAAAYVWFGLARV